MDSESEKFEFKLDYPVSIEAILNVSFSLEGFKSVFDFILEVLRRHESTLKSHSDKHAHLSTLSSDLSKLREDLNSSQKQSSTELSSLASDQASLLSRLASLESLKSSSESFQSELLERVSKLELTQASQGLTLESHESSLQSHESTLQSHDSSLQSHDSALQDHDSSLQSILKRLEELSSNLDRNNRILEVFKQDLENLQNKTERIERNASEVKEKVDGHTAKIAEHERRLHKLEMDMHQALKAIGSLGGEVEQISRPAEPMPQEVVVVDNTRVDLLADSLKDLEMRMKNNEDNVARVKVTSEKAENLAKQVETELKRLENDLKKLMSKPQNPVKIEVETKGKSSAGPAHSDGSGLRILQLEELIKSKADNEAYLKSFQELRARLDEHEMKIQALEMNLNKRALRSELEDFLKKAFENRQVAKADDSIEPSKLMALSKRIGILEDHLKSLHLPEGFDLLIITNILVKLQQESKESKEKQDKNFKDLWNKLYDLEDLLSKKAGLDKLKDLEEMLLSKLREMYEDLMKKFADKAETKRALKYLEKLIKEFEGGKVVRDGEDAMLARKPLGGWSCASCQKDLEKLMGKIGPYHAWNKMPYRDPADRIARAGPGFSRMLASVQPDMLTQRAKQSTYYQSIEEETTETKGFPSVKKPATERPFTSL